MPAWQASGPLLRCHNPSRSFAWRPRTYHSDLGHAATVHRRDLEPVALDLDGVSDGGEAPEATEHEPADGVVGLVRQPDAQPVAERLERGEPIDDHGPGRLLFEAGGFSIELVLHLTDQLLDHVLERHASGGAAELVEDDRQLHALSPELRERLVAPHGLRHDGHFPHHVARARPVFFVDPDKILYVNDADDVIEVFLVHRKAREAMLSRGHQDLGHGGIVGDSDDLGPRHHHLADDAVCELHGSSYDHPLALLEDALSGRDGDEHLERLFTVDVDLVRGSDPRDADTRGEPGASTTLLSKLIELRLPDTDERVLGRHEEPVRQNEKHGEAKSDERIRVHERAILAPPLGSYRARARSFVRLVS